MSRFRENRIRASNSAIGSRLRRKTRRVSSDAPKDDVKVDKPKPSKEREEPVSKASIEILEGKKEKLTKPKAPKAKPRKAKTPKKQNELDHDAQQTFSDDDFLPELLAKRANHIARISEVAEMLELEIAATKALDQVITLYEPNHTPWGASDLVRGPLQSPSAGRMGYMEPKEYQSLEEFFGSDERSAVVLDILNKAGKPIASADIATEYVRLKKATVGRELMVAITSRISAILARLRNRGKVKSIDLDGWKKTWHLT